MGEALVPSNALPVTLALAEVNAGRPAWPAHLVSAVADPDRCPADLLGYLAWAWSVDVWDETWTERKKRYVIGRAFLDHRLKGTLAGIARYCRYVDAKVIDVVAPPQRFVLGARRTPAERAALYARLPEIRIYPNVVARAARGAFWGRFFWSAGATFRSPKAKAAREVRAELRRDGKIIPLRVADVASSNIDDDTAPFERLFLPRKAGPTRIVGHIRPRSFWSGRDPAKAVVSFHRTIGGIGPGTVRPGLFPAVASPERVFPRAHAPAAKAFHRRMRRRFFTPSTAAERIYDRLRLWDDAVNLREPRRGSYWGVSRRGHPALTAIVSPEIIVQAPRQKRFHGQPIGGFLVPHDPRPLDQAKAAIRAAKLPHERILIDLATAFERRFYGAMT